MHRHSRVLLLASLLLCASSPAPAEESRPSRWSVRACISGHYSIGDYGLERDTELVYLPFIGRLSIEDWALELTVPYLYIRGPAGIFGIITTPEETGSRRSESGLGDLRVSASYRIAPPRRWLPDLTLEAGLKMPTADEDRGLGTGAFDLDLLADAAWAASDRLSVFARLGYRFLGDSSEFDLNDGLVASIGPGYRILDSVDVGLLADYQQATADEIGDSVSLIPYLTWRLTPEWGIDAYGSFGLAEGAADFGGGAQLSYLW